MAKKRAAPAKKRKPAERPYWKMRKCEGRGYVDTRQAPEWWLSRPDEVEAFLRSLPGVKVKQIATSAGGRPVIAAEWGKYEPPKNRTCFSLGSAMGSKHADAYYGDAPRERQSFAFVGAAHGTELEGTVAALNLLNVAITGKDLRGREWPRMAEEARKQRIVIIPFLNIDGRARYEQTRHHVGVFGQDYQACSQGFWKDGTRVTYPLCKRFWPIPPKSVKKMGSYYNDAGYNLVYDFGWGKHAQPETHGLLEYLQGEMPDCVLCSHTNNGNLIQQASNFIPDHYRVRTFEIGGAVAGRCKLEGMKKFQVPRLFYPFGFYQTDMIFHATGALSFICEFPCGWANVPDNHDEVLDISMYVLEEVLAFGNTHRYRPAEPI